jgi:hypothetical protein
MAPKAVTPHWFSYESTLLIILLAHLSFVDKTHSLRHKASALDGSRRPISITYRLKAYSRFLGCPA